MNKGKTIKSEKTQIQLLSDKRQQFLDKYYDSWDPSIGDFGEYTLEEPEEIDKLAIEIEEKLIEYKDLLEVDFIIEQLTKLGQAPCVLYDDNGNFAVVSDGFQEINDEISDMVLTHFVKKEMWKPTIREALYLYLNL